MRTHGKYKRLCKIGWPVVLAVWLVLASFGISIPAPEEAGMDLLTSFEVWIANNVRYPGMFSVGLGLLIGTVIIPNVWSVAREKWFYDPSPNERAGDVLSYIMNESKWGREQTAAKSLVGASVQFRDKARKSKMKVWGAPEIAGTNENPRFSTQETEISPDHWWKFELNLDAFSENTAVSLPETVAENPNDPLSLETFRYSRLRVDRTQVNRLWKRPNIAVRAGYHLGLRKNKWRGANI